MRKVTRNSESPVQKAVWKACFPAHTEQISLLPEQAQKLHTSGRSNAGKSFSEVYFYLPRSSVLLFVLDINLWRYICLFSPRNSAAGYFRREKKINQREKQNPNQTSSFCKWAPGVPLAVKSYFHSSLGLQNFIIAAWKMLLSLSTCYFWFLTNHCNPSTFIVQIVIAVNYLRTCRNLRLWSKRKFKPCKELKLL